MSLLNLAVEGLRDWLTVAISTLAAGLAFGLSFAYPLQSVGILLLVSSIAVLISFLWKKREGHGFPKRSGPKDF